MNKLLNSGFRLRPLFLLLFGLFAGPVLAQDSLVSVRELHKFDEIQVGRGLEVELVKGDTEKLEILSLDDLEASDIRVEYKGSTLIVYVDGWRKGWEKRFPDNVSAKIRISWKELEEFEKRGEESVRFLSPIVGSSFKMRLYGESDVRIDSLDLRRLKVVCIGDNRVEIAAGHAKFQEYKMTGESVINTGNHTTVQN